MSDSFSIVVVLFAVAIGYIFDRYLMKAKPVSLKTLNNIPVTNWINRVLGTELDSGNVHEELPQYAQQQINQLKERVAILESIVTDKSYQLRKEIDQL